MQRFKFKLQTVYDLRKHVEKEHKDSLSREKIKLDELNQRAQQLAGDTAYWAENFIQQAGEGFTPGEANLIHSYLSELNRLSVENENRIASQNEVVETKRLQLIEKMKERKMMEALYERQYSGFFLEEQRKEEKNIEELIMGRFKKYI